MRCNLSPSTGQGFAKFLVSVLRVLEVFLGLRLKLFIILPDLIQRKLVLVTVLTNRSSFVCLPSINLKLLMLAGDMGPILYPHPFNDHSIRETTSSWSSFSFQLINVVAVPVNYLSPATTYLILILSMVRYFQLNALVERESFRYRMSVYRTVRVSLRWNLNFFPWKWQ